MSEEKNTFWAFSLSFYAEPAVQNACIRLQESIKADVNILLFLLYQASQGKQITASSIHLLDESVKHWREDVIQAIRHIRRILKHTDYHLGDDIQATFRKKLMSVELDAEKLEQEKLESLALSLLPTTISQAVKANLQQYANTLGSDDNHPDFVILLEHFMSTIRLPKE